jgi:stearoyl-CoA desaturase (delta-9 desaturase)
VNADRQEHPVALAEKSTPLDETAPTAASGPKPVTVPMPRGTRTLIGVFIVIPLLAVLAAIPVAWGGWLGWTDVILAAVFYAISAIGITVGFHRYFTHGSFKAPRAVRVGLAIAGSAAIEGSLTQWVADHRLHHSRSDEEGDPHSPWRFGTSRRALAKGLAFAHIGWLFDGQQTSVERYAPDIAADKDLARVSRFFPLIVLASLLLPAVLGGLITWSWWGALTAFFWAGLVRVALVHHVTWSINSVCHVFGKRPFTTRDNSSNVAWLAIPSFGESWHNLHHAEPTSARHGVLRGQLDLSAEFIRVMEKLRLASDVRWPNPARIAAKLKDPAMRRRIPGWVEPSDT